MTVEFNQVNYVYQQGTPYEYHALRDITTQFDDGKYYAVIGQTGSGKSTLIQHFNGLLKPTTGTMVFNDIVIQQKTKDKLLRDIRKKVGIVFQFPESQLFEDSVDKEIEFGPKNFGMDIEKVKKRAFQLLLEFGFPREIMTLSPFQMSGGQMRKIALTSILAMDPDIIILDEPTAGLDPQSKKQIMRKIKELQQQHNKTIILITHEMNDVAKYADEVKLMHNGELTDDLTPRELFADSDAVNKYQLDVPEVVKLQRDVEEKYHFKFDKVALTEEEFVEMYKEWRSNER